MGCFVSMCSSSCLAVSFGYPWGQESASMDPLSSPGAPQSRLCSQSRAGVNEGTWAALGRGCCMWGGGKPIWGIGETWRLLFPSGEVGKEGQQARSHLLAQPPQGVACEANFLWEEEKESHGSCPNPLLRKRVRPDRVDLGLYLGVLGIACAGEAPGARGRR